MARKKNIGTMIDKLYDLKEAHDVTLIASSKAKSKYDDQRDRVINELKSQDLDGANGTKAKVSLNQTLSATISDYTKFERYVYANKALHLLNKTPNTKAWREILEDRKGRPIPGLSPYNRLSLRLTKRR